MLITLANVREFVAVPGNWPLQYIQGSKKFWYVGKRLEIQLSDGRTITIPEGFKTDLSSVPRWLWNVESSYGDFLFAALIHDFLYVYNIGTRTGADREMLIWSCVLNDNQTDNFIRYKAVRYFGSRWWNKKAKYIHQ